MTFKGREMENDKVDQERARWNEEREKSVRYEDTNSSLKA